MSYVIDSDERPLQLWILSVAQLRLLLVTSFPQQQSVSKKGAQVFVVDPESYLQIMSALLFLVGAVVVATLAAQLLCYLFCCGCPTPTGKVMVEKGVQISLFETETNDDSDCGKHDPRTPFAGRMA